MSLSNRWTGGQYSIFRMLFGLFLLQHFLALLPWGPELFSNRGAMPDASASPIAYLFPNLLVFFDAPGVVTSFLVSGALASVLLVLGWHDRIAAVWIWYVLACLFGRNPLILNPSMPFLGWLLLAHATLPSAPYGSWAARGREDPGGGWRFPGPIFAAAWILMALAYSYSGYTKLTSPSWIDGSALARILQNPLARPGFARDALLNCSPVLLNALTWLALGLELSFGPLALVRKLRPWIWLGMLGMHLGLIVTVQFADLSCGMVILHFFTFDPAWLAARPPARDETVFYDGHCALCHRLVRFVLAEQENNAGRRFRFAPLFGEHFSEVVSEKERATLLDSVVVHTEDGRLLQQSTALFYVLDRLGGIWRLAALSANLIPRSFHDAIYEATARMRYRVFGRKGDVCPLIPVEHRASFLA